jgi:hypothetical protein
MQKTEYFQITKKKLFYFWHVFNQYLTILELIKYVNNIKYNYKIWNQQIISSMIN